jgi:hypothetical protein
VKYLIVLALIALLLWFVYRRLRPYIQMVKKVLGMVTGTLDKDSAPSEFGRSVGTENKLIRCGSCNTWIPEGRALHANSTAYCSTACLKKAPAVKRRREAS